MTRPFLSFWTIFFAAQILSRAGAAEPAPMSALLLENDVLRLRVPHVMGDFAEQDLLAGQALNQSAGKLTGVILDLRSADGDQNAAPAVGRFFADKKYPVVILVNGQTRGSAATLAVDLRTAGDGILVGTTNFNGKIHPDITVTVSGEDEKKFLADPFFVPPAPKLISASATNEFLEFVDHTSEADLVRKRVKDGEDDGPVTPRVEPAQPVIRDPALARALDLFKALAALQPARG